MKNTVIWLTGVILFSFAGCSIAQPAEVLEPAEEVISVQNNDAADAAAEEDDKAAPDRAIAGSEVSPVSADYLDDVSDQYPAYEDASELMKSDPSEYETVILFYTSEDVSDFRVLSLELTGVDENGNPDFNMTEVFNIPVLKADTPLAVPMSFPGDIPSNGFSYTGADGNVLTFTVSQSGYDGSLVTSPIGQ